MGLSKFSHNASSTRERGAIPVVVIVLGAVALVSSLVIGQQVNQRDSSVGDTRSRAESCPHECTTDGEERCTNGQKYVCRTVALSSACPAVRLWRSAGGCTQPTVQPTSPPSTGGGGTQPTQPPANTCALTGSAPGCEGKPFGWQGDYQGTCIRCFDNDPSGNRCGRDYCGTTTLCDGDCRQATAENPTCNSLGYSAGSGACIQAGYVCCAGLLPTRIPTGTRTPTNTPTSTRTPFPTPTQTQLGNCTTPCYSTAGCTCPNNCLYSVVSNIPGTCGGIRSTPTPTCVPLGSIVGSGTCCNGLVVGNSDYKIDICTTPTRTPIPTHTPIPTPTPDWKKNCPTQTKLDIQQIGGDCNYPGVYDCCAYCPSFTYLENIGGDRNTCRERPECPNGYSCVYSSLVGSMSTLHVPNACASGFVCARPLPTQIPTLTPYPVTRVPVPPTAPITTDGPSRPASPTSTPPRDTPGITLAPNPIIVPVITSGPAPTSGPTPTPAPYNPCTLGYCPALGIGMCDFNHYPVEAGAICGGFGYRCCSKQLPSPTNTPTQTPTPAPTNTPTRTPAPDPCEGKRTGEYWCTDNNISKYCIVSGVSVSVQTCRSDQRCSSTGSRCINIPTSTPQPTAIPSPYCSPQRESDCDSRGLLCLPSSSGGTCTTASKSLGSTCQIHRECASNYCSGNVCTRIDACGGLGEMPCSACPSGRVTWGFLKTYCDYSPLPTRTPTPTNRPTPSPTNTTAPTSTNTPTPITIGLGVQCMGSRNCTCIIGITVYSIPPGQSCTSPTPVIQIFPTPTSTITPTPIRLVGQTCNPWPGVISIWSGYPECFNCPFNGRFQWVGSFIEYPMCGPAIIQTPTPVPTTVLSCPTGFTCTPISTIDSTTMEFNPVNGACSPNFICARTRPLSPTPRVSNPPTIGPSRALIPTSNPRTDTPGITAFARPATPTISLSTTPTPGGCRSSSWLLPVTNAGQCCSGYAQERPLWFVNVLFCAERPPATTPTPAPAVPQVPTGLTPALSPSSGTSPLSPSREVTPTPFCVPDGWRYTDVYPCCSGNKVYDNYYGEICGTQQLPTPTTNPNPTASVPPATPTLNANGCNMLQEFVCRFRPNTTCMQGKCEPNITPTSTPNPTPTKTPLTDCRNPCINTSGCTCPPGCLNESVFIYGSTCDAVLTNTPIPTTIPSPTIQPTLRICSMIESAICKYNSAVCDNCQKPVIPTGTTRPTAPVPSTTPTLNTNGCNIFQQFICRWTPNTTCMQGKCEPNPTPTPDLSQKEEDLRRANVSYSTVTSTLEPSLSALTVMINCSSGDGSYLNAPAYPGASRTNADVCYFLNVTRQGSTCTPDRIDGNNQIILCKQSFNSLPPSTQTELINHELTHIAQDRIFIPYAQSIGYSPDDTSPGIISNQQSFIGIAELGAQLNSHNPNSPGSAFQEDYKFGLVNPNGVLISTTANTQQALQHLITHCPGSTQQMIEEALGGNQLLFQQLNDSCIIPPYDLIPDRIRI